ncbi:MAG: tRNA (guanosine(37)-N1)-methyltransferase TrmD [Gudongella sp.]|jgi:tRNA (guanine37-N1)-methyltransferase|nr:tRNA (guanosine(37)-N1)-methyltransferase TrmD [Gudongella sp.]
MRIDILTLFPEFIKSLENYSIVGRALQEDILKLSAVDIRDYTEDKHRRVDDYPYGGGMGMVIQPQPVYSAIASVRTDKSRVIYLSPQGKPLEQEKVNELSKEEHLVLLAGHYEGVDQRIIDDMVDEELSIGDYVLTGGELPAMVLVDSIARVLPGVLSSEDSYEIESHYNGLLEYPQYTRPRVFMGRKVPDVLLSGDHEKIRLWRLLNSFRTTIVKRPDMISKLKEDSEELEELSKLLGKLSKR